jgi:ligand-binding sensor domain-containing protein
VVRHPGRGGFRYDTSLQSFTTDDGLTSNGVMCVVEDRAGELWFGTWEGVCRFDGEQFIPFEPLAGKNVWSMLEDRYGMLWFGAMDQEEKSCVGRYDGRDFTAWGGKDGLAHYLVTCMAEDRDGRVWFGTDKGVDGYASEKFTPLDVAAQPLEHVKALLVDRQGYLWLGHALDTNKICRFDGRRLEVIAQGDNEVGLGVWTILEDRQGRIWFGTLGQGVYCHDGTHLTRFSTAAGLSHDWVHAILEDRHGTLWFGTFGGGVSLFDGQVFQTLSQRDGLPHDTVQSLIEDRHGAIWIGTEGVVARYRPQTLPPKVGVLSGGKQDFIGVSPPVQQAQTQLQQVATTDWNVLIRGETGTGKGMAARSLNQISPRRDHALIEINCSAIPEGLVESELFGHERGAFTGAVSRQLGKVELLPAARSFWTK